MKQLLLLVMIHLLIFHQQEKDKQEKTLTIIEKKNITATHMQKKKQAPIQSSFISYDSLLCIQRVPMFQYDFGPAKFYFANAIKSSDPFYNY